MHDGASRLSRSAGVRGRLVGLFVGPLAFALVLAWPLELPDPAHRLAAVFAWVVVYWFTEAIPPAATALLSSVLAILLGVAPAKTVFAPYADPIIFLFVGGFMLAEAMHASGLDRRLAFLLLRRAWATRTPSRLLGSVGVVTTGISLWVSNTATTAMLLPVGRGLLRSVGLLGDAARSRFPVALLLMLSWASSVAVGIPVGSPPNLIAIGMVRDLTGQRLTFFDWVAVTLPLTVVMLLLVWFILRAMFRVPRTAQEGLGATVEEQHRALGPMTRREWNVAAVFVVACVLWMLPGAVAIFTSPDAPLPRFFETHLPESVVALLAALLLFVLPTSLRRAEFTLGWREASRIDWGTILLFGGGLSLGRLMFDTKLAEILGQGIVVWSGAQGVWALTAVAIVVGIVLSEVSSNTASASMVTPVMIAIALAGDMSPIPPAMGAALGASFGFMLPVSTPPNAIVYGTGLVPLRDMIRTGLVLDVLGAVVIWVGLRLLCPLFGVL